MNDITNEDRCIGIIRAILRDTTASEKTKELCELILKDNRYLVSTLTITQKLLAFHSIMERAMKEQIIKDRLAAFTLLNKNE